MRRRDILALGPVLLGGCRRRGGVARRSLEVGSAPHITMSPLYLAEESGYFRDAGLQVAIREVTQTSQIIPLVAGGELDAAFVTMHTTFLNAAGKGARIRVVAGRNRVVPGCGSGSTLYGSRKLFPEGRFDLRKLAGQRIGGTRPGSYQEFSLDTVLSTAGMSTADIKMMSMPEADAFAALISGKIEAVMATYFEQDFAALSSQVVRGIGMADAAPGHQHTFICYGPTLLDGEHKVGVAFLAAYLRGARGFVEGRTPRWFDEFARMSRMDVEKARAACRNVLTPDGAIDLPSIQRYVDWAVRKKYCTKPVEPAQLVDTSFLRGAWEHLGWNRKSGGD
jgi:ABC-type nitrate/sulfonate/bicarbonate transport system substrate-binding protein